jgi:hypothetical protein
MALRSLHEVEEDEPDEPEIGHGSALEHMQRMKPTRAVFLFGGSPSFQWLLLGSHSKREDKLDLQYHLVGCSSVHVYIYMDTFSYLHLHVH